MSCGSWRRRNRDRFQLRSRYFDGDLACVRLNEIGKCIHRAINDGGDKGEKENEAR